MINVRRIMQEIPAQKQVKALTTTPAFVKSATKNEQAAMDYFQRATVSKDVPLVFNRETKRLFNKLKIN